MKRVICAMLLLGAGGLNQAQAAAPAVQPNAAAPPAAVVPAVSPTPAPTGAKNRRTAVKPQAPIAALEPLPSPQLTDAQSEVLRAIARDEFCGCKSALTLAGCLEKRPDCRLAQDLRAVLARGLTQGATHSALEVYMSQEVLGPFCAAPTLLAVPGAGRLGSPQAPIEVVEFADFRCTHCRQAMPMVHDAVQRLQGVVQLHYVPLSLVDHPHSTAAAEAVLAAGGQQKFWPMHAALFAREQGDYDMPVLEAAAKTAGLNLKQFRQDMRSHRYLKTLEDFKKQALAADITGTPAFFINGRRFMPTPGIFELTDRLDMERVRDQPTCQ